ncbi:hypothetical protein GF342_04095 [Candidatus Woesearchaeota archaeon]|nr:hypothetical protein [Candidatus Woesearchaeota archaeon]
MLLTRDHTDERRSLEQHVDLEDPRVFDHFDEGESGIYRAFSDKQGIDAKVWELDGRLACGDTMVLLTKGAYSPFRGRTFSGSNRRRLYRILKTSSSPETAAEKILDYAASCGSRERATAVVIRIDD